MKKLTLKQTCPVELNSTLRMYGNHMEAVDFQIILGPQMHKMLDCILTSDQLASYFSLAKHDYILQN